MVVDSSCLVIMFIRGENCVCKLYVQLKKIMGWVEIEGVLSEYNEWKVDVRVCDEWVGW